MGAARRAALILVCALSASTRAQELEVVTPVDRRVFILRLAGHGDLRETTDPIQGERLIRTEQVLAAVWSEETDLGMRHFYRTRVGRRWSPLWETEYTIHLRWREFDPLDSKEPRTFIDAEGVRLYLVQFHTPPFPDYDGALGVVGAEVHRFLPSHTKVVSIPNEDVLDQVQQLEFVRWAGAYLPEYRLEPALLPRLEDGSLERGRYTIQLVESGAEAKAVVLRRILASGGIVETTPPDGYLLEATLTAPQLQELLRWDEVLFVDSSVEPEPNAVPGPRAPRSAPMGLVREDGGANLLASTLGLTGQGVVGEVVDFGVLATHPDIAPVVLHGKNGTNFAHGTPPTGIVFGDGGMRAGARGLLPDGTPVVASVRVVQKNRPQHTEELVQEYQGLFQSNSWNLAGLNYSNRTAELDDVIRSHDLLVLQSMGTATHSAPGVLAWSKNALCIGGVRHEDTPEPEDDAAVGGQGIRGFAPDDRVKPDLCYWHDDVFTIDAQPLLTGRGGLFWQAQYGNFSGTSASTPQVAGYAGLVFQLWREPEWHTAVMGSEPSGSVFDARPHSATVRALLINSASPYPFSGVGSGDGSGDGPGEGIGRREQGWGRPNLRPLVDRRDVLFVLDEGVPLATSESAAWRGTLGPDEPSLRATLVFTDPPALPGASVHRVNDLSLLVTSPSETTYWGNAGLDVAPWSSSSGSSDGRNTVENVFVEEPEPGSWTVEVLAPEVPDGGAEFALVVTGLREVERLP